MNLRRLNVLIYFSVFFIGSAAFLRAEETSEISKEKFSSLVKKIEDGTELAEIPFKGSRHEKENLHYVFVTGFLSFQHPDYFLDQMSALRKMGIPRKNIHILKPSSRYPVETSAKWLKKELEDIPGKLVVIAHSKGGADTLTLSLNEISFVKDRVEGIYILQGSIGGSPFADMVTNPHFDWSVFDSFSFSERNQILLERLKALVPQFVFNPALKSLRTTVRNDRNLHLLETQKPYLDIVSPKIHYLTAEIQDPSRYRKDFYTRWKVLSEGKEPSDGLVLLSDQKLEGLGNVIWQTDAGHGDLTNRRITTFPIEKREAWAKAIAFTVESKSNLSKTNCPWILKKIK